MWGVEAGEEMGGVGGDAAEALGCRGMKGCGRGFAFAGFEARG